jgi:RNA polymerase sigma factor (sigma-70 family)
MRARPSHTVQAMATALQEASRAKPRKGHRERLSPDRERALVGAAAKGDQAARDELVESFMPLIGSVARSYRDAPSVDRTELLQEGVVGLLRAVPRYDCELGTPFWAYASWWVRQAMQQLVSELTRPFVLSDRALRRLARIKDARRAYLRRCGREPSAGELADATGFTRDQIDSLLVAERIPRGFEEPLGAEPGGSSTVGELVPDPAAQDDFGRVGDRFDVERLRELSTLLGERELRIVSAHYGIGGPAQTLREIAGGFGLSVERVRQIEERALGRLHDAFEDPDAGRRRPGALRELPAGDDAHELREHLRRVLDEEQVADRRAADMVIAAHEVAACVWQDGRRPERVRFGQIDGSLVCEIRDQGQGLRRKHNLGLWMASRLGARIEEHTSPAGHMVRVWI